ncbi:Rho-binding antiterminator [Pseudomonas sp. SWRI153]|uniref:Rho-binding antiterminator n=1 Tax=Pseudomonas khorasanensis TaxID=2745508 RepID=A0A923F665_9PSED|nr:Rho-binding antiterminator [Pseudomonas khorasanensis]MBV4487955.1 Rho-binding antiterminator [Pseudomonas khorasanensis]
MTRYQPLNCDLYDYLEIACMRGYQLDIELIDGQRLAAKAITIRTTSDKEEFMEIEQAGEQSEIRLDQLLAITPQAADAEFGRIVFNEPSCSIK